MCLCMTLVVSIVGVKEPLYDLQNWWLLGSCQAAAVAAPRLPMQWGRRGGSPVAPLAARCLQPCLVARGVKNKPWVLKTSPGVILSPGGVIVHPGVWLTIPRGVIL